MSLAVLSLQRQGRLSAVERWGWIGAWLVVVGGLAIAVIADGQPMEQLSERVRLTEVAMSIVYAAMQACYSLMEFRELQRMQEAIENYYDREHKGLTRWMKHAIAVTGLMAVFVPVFVFGPNLLLIIYGLAFFWGIFMMWFCFVRYFLTGDMKRVREAEENACEERSEERSKMSDDDGGLPEGTMKHIDQAVERWLATGGHLRSGITSPVAADAMNIPRYQLTAWVKASGHSSFTRWITSLRIEEAKRVLRDHPEWSNEAVADHCGFSRAYFQKIFKQETGVVPSSFLSRND